MREYAEDKPPGNRTSAKGDGLNGRDREADIDPPRQAAGPPGMLYRGDPRKGADRDLAVAKVRPPQRRTLTIE